MKFLVNFLIVGSIEIEAETESEARRKFQNLADAGGAVSAKTQLPTLILDSGQIDDIIMEDVISLEDALEDA